MKQDIQMSIDKKPIKRTFAKKTDRYWLTPPDLYERLNQEFHFDFDPCPYPLPDGFNGLNIEWGASNYVNPPFIRDAGVGPTDFIRKGIEESRKGKTVVFVLPVYSWINLLLEAGVEIRPLGRVRWVEVDSLKPMPGPHSNACFILRSKLSDIKVKE